MSAMKDIATELELFWDNHGDYWQRLLPDGESVYLVPVGARYQVLVQWRAEPQRGLVDEVDGLAEAVARAGQIAQRQLLEQYEDAAKDWVA